MHRHAGSSLRHLRLLAAALLCSAACAPLSPDALKAFGTIVVHVDDDRRMAVRDVLIQVHDIPNAVGSFYGVGQWTGSDGTTSIRLITAGHHRVEMTVPAGFTAGPTGALREIDIAAGGSVVVQFEIVRR